MAGPAPTSRSEGRSESRIPQILAAEISDPDKSVRKEMTFAAITLIVWKKEVRFDANHLKQQAA
jgi:hypothetical protein